MSPGAPSFLEVARGVLEGGYGVQLSTRGDSMTPLIRGGSLIEIKQAEVEGLRFGDVLVYRDRGMLVAHRLVGKRREQGGLLLITRGDAAPWSDRREVAPGQVLGRVCAVHWRRGLCLRIDSGWGRILSLVLGVSWPLPQGIFAVLVKVRTGLDRFRTLPK